MKELARWALAGAIVAVITAPPVRIELRPRPPAPVTPAPAKRSLCLCSQCQRGRGTAELWLSGPTVPHAQGRRLELYKGSVA